MKEIKLNNTDKTFLIDDEDFDKVSKYSWNVNKHQGTDRYKNITTSSTWRRFIILARYIMNLTVGDGKVVDHKDHNIFDNRKQNLRTCNNNKNMKNKRLLPGRKFKGTVFVKSTGKYRAAITVNMKAIHLGTYLTEQEAEESYNIAAKKYFGEFACLNSAINLLCPSTEKINPLIVKQL